MPTLYEAFIAEENFLAAYNRVAAKGSRGGVDKVSVGEFGQGLKRNLTGLRRAIETGTYAPQPVEAVSIPKYNADNEWRELGLPTVADKIVQAALLHVVEPLAEQRFLDSSYAYRRGKGHSKAVRRVDHYLTNQRCRWAAVQDIDNCFDSLDHDLLLSEFTRLVGGEQRLVDLVALWCRSGIVARDGHWKNVEAGVRQGQIISPLLANLYLHPLDVFVQTHTWNWVRYADNYLLLGEHEEGVRDADQQVKTFLSDTLHLSLNHTNSPIRSLEDGFVFLGIWFQGTSRLIAREKMDKIQRRLEWICSPKGSKDLSILLNELAYKTEGWRRYYGFLKPNAQFKEIQGWLEAKLEALIINRVKTSIVWLGACINFSSFSSLPFSLAAWLWRLIPGKLACLVLDLEA